MCPDNQIKASFNQIDRLIGDLLDDFNMRILRQEPGDNFFKRVLRHTHATAYPDLARQRIAPSLQGCPGRFNFIESRARMPVKRITRICYLKLSRRSLNQSNIELLLQLADTPA